MPNEIDPSPVPQASAQHPGVVLLTCIDSRLIELVPGQQPGDVLMPRNVGAAIPARGDRSTEAELMFPLEEFSGVHTVVIMGHTACGAMQKMTHAMLDGARRGERTGLDQILSLPNARMRELTLRAGEKGMAADAIAAELERIMPLLSVKRLMARTITHEGEKMRFGEFIARKGITLVPALYELGGAGLQVFDFEQDRFVTPEQVHTQGRRDARAVAFASVKDTTVGTVTTEQALSRALRVAFEKFERKIDAFSPEL